MPYRTVDWQEQNKSLFQALKLEKLGMGLILLLIVLVAAFNIVSTLTMVVTDKTREIGILQGDGHDGAFGAPRIFRAGPRDRRGRNAARRDRSASPRRSRSASISSSSWIRQIYFIDHLPVATRGSRHVCVTIVASVGIAALATLYPSMQAARLYPIEAIRHE